eukprot:2686785-Lingulodinium_polyedra.AAC.1
MIAFSEDWGGVKGPEPAWADYFRNEYLHLSSVDGVGMFTASWHSGLDNTHIPFVGLTNHLESYNMAIKRRLAAARADCVRQNGRAAGLPALEAAMAHLGQSFQAELQANQAYQQGARLRSDRHAQIP